MSFKPLISVIVPVYNGADYVIEAIDSILEQSYTNFEIIVVNDGSTDNGATRRAIEPYLGRIKYIEQENGGVAAALNTGISNMNGEFFAWLSHDDLFLPDKLKTQVAILSVLPDPVVALYSDYSIIDFQKKHLYDVVLDAYMLINSSNHMPVLRGCLNGCTMLIHRDVFAECGVFDPALRHTQDYEMWERICWKFPMIHQDKITVHQRVHDAQDSKRSDAVPECNTLWINIIEKRDEAIRTEISGSSLMFLEGMQKFLEQTPYGAAQKFVQDEILALQDPQSEDDTQNAPVAEIAASFEMSVPVITPIMDTNSVDLSGLSIVINNTTTREAALRSIYNMSHLKSENYEIIFIDSGSDEDAVLAETLRKQTPHVVIIKCKGGLSETRQRAISESQYDFVMFTTTQDFILESNLSAQLTSMKDDGFGVTYAPYLSVCREFSDKGVIVPSHWLENVTVDDIVTKFAFNLSSMVFQKMVFQTGIAPPSTSTISEFKFLLTLRQRFTFHPYKNISIISYTHTENSPINLTRSLDESSELLRWINDSSSGSISADAKGTFEQLHASLYAIKLSNEKSGDYSGRNRDIEHAYVEGINPNNLIGNITLLDVDI